MENMRKRIKIRVVKNSQDFIKYTLRPTCVNWKVFENNLAAIHEKKISLTLNKPIYVGFTVLEKSRWEMYKYKELFDLSNFLVNKYYCSDNKKVLGKMNNEYGGNMIIEFIGLRLKMYSILDANNNEKNTSNGHNAFIEFQEFYNKLFNIKILRDTMRGIQSKSHNLGTY